MGKPKRNILATAEETLRPPSELSSSQYIARVAKAAELPGRFRSTIWIKRGGYVLVDTESGQDRENKIDGEIVNVVREEKQWRKMKYWPAEFDKRDDDSDEEDQIVGKMPPEGSDDED